MRAIPEPVPVAVSVSGSANDAVFEGAAADRRGADRRQRPTPMLSRYTFFGGRRQASRRREERGSGFVDRWGSFLFAVVCAIAALNFLDAWFTIYLLSWGGSEMNPLIDAVIKMGVWPFVAVKSVGIGACVAILTITSRFPIARIGLGLVFVGYFVLILWHAYLLQLLPAFANIG